MAQVISGGGDDAFNALAFPNQDPSLQTYILDSINQFKSQVTGTAVSFYDQAMETYNKISSAEAMRKARSAMRKVGSLWEDDTIVQLLTINQLQDAKSKMQRWVMAEPTVRDRYLRQECDGYSETYVNVHGDDIGENHYDYRRVMDGMLHEEDGELFFTTYGDEVLGDTDDLEIDQQVDILNTWDQVKYFMELNEEDPTSQDGGYL